MLSNSENMIIRDLRMLAPEQQEQVIKFIQRLIKESVRHETIWDKIDKPVPLEMWESVPADGAEQHDHYLYGSSKK
ncbi:MAG: hypothetical protein BWK80_50260 [Desulfobacteraceae bacterium IS3]|nr:MAG: hypothetical protein BWK80_50260 [Desulfobacteraceae bacterium IS3]